MPTVRKEMCTISKYQDFDSEIFEVTKIMIGFSLTDGQKTELLKIAGEIEAACQDGSLSGDERQRLLDTMGDCGLELPQSPTEPVVDEAKLQERLAQYMELELFQMDIGELIRDYKSQGASPCHRWNNSGRRLPPKPGGAWRP